MRHRVVAYMLGFALASNSALADPAPKIASTSLCGDGYLLALAPRQISALSWQSRDPLSRAPEEFRALPQIWDDPETLLASNADIILFGSGEGMTSKSYLAARDMQSVELVWGEDFDAVAENFRTIGKVANVSKKVEIILDQMDRHISELTYRASQRQTQPKVLYLSRAGGSAGTGTFIDAAIRVAGGTNIVETSGWVNLEPETMISLKPNLIVTSYFQDGYESVNASGFRHRAVHGFIANHPRIDIPGSLWPCAGPDLITAAEMIADAMDRLQ